MSLNYLLDGYNIIHHLPAPAPEKFEDDKERLVRLIETHRPHGSSRNTITVIFDGYPPGAGRIESAVVKIIFSQGESADDCIKKIVFKSALKKNIVVVTNDRDIKFSVRAQGCRVLSVEEFLSKIVTRPAGHSGKKTNTMRTAKQKHDDKYISQTLEHKITSEFENIWLNHNDRPGKKSDKNN